MRCAWLFCLASILCMAYPASADLQTSAFDDVKAEVEARDALLTGELDKAETKLKKTFGKVLKEFAKESDSSKDDAKAIAKITKTLVKVFPPEAGDDAEMLALITDGLSSFVLDIADDLLYALRSVDAIDSENKGLKGADKAVEKAEAAIAAVDEEPDLAKKANAIKKAEAAVGKVWKSSYKALSKQDLTVHQETFLFDMEGGYAAGDCLTCHAQEGIDVMASAHFNWQGVAEKIEGYETGVHGKADLINNFCITIESNEGRCAQCHIGTGWTSNAYDPASAAPSSVDCLVCHDTTGTYKKGKTSGGAPEPTVDLTMVAMNVGEPARDNCGACHFFAGGGDNVKHGDLSSAMVTATREMDVHMGSDGGNFNCQTCHQTTSHRIPGQELHSQDEGRVSCTTCHDTATLPGMSHASNHLEAVACQTCHIPAFARELPTKVSWLWEDAGQDVDPIPTDQFGKPLYDKKKGTFVWAKDVVPELRWSNSKWERMMLGVNDQYTETPVSLARPMGEKDDGVSKIYPFKKMVGNQPADAVNKTMLVPHLFGMGPGPNPFWVEYDWLLAVQEGAAYAGQTFTGNLEFVDTEMYLSVNHEIAPKEQARSCSDCHNGGIDWTELGYSGDPMSGGS